MRQAHRQVHRHAHLHKPLKWVKRWYVSSHTNPDKRYTVSLANDDETWGCSCPHWTRNYPRPTCKHIKEVQIMLAGKEILIGNIVLDEFFTEEEFTL